MRGMKFQFSLLSLFVYMTFVAMICIGILGFVGILNANTRIGPGHRYYWSFPFNNLAMNLPLWLPFAFLAYALGRRTVTIPMLVVFAVSQAVAWGIGFLVCRSFGAI
jgi:hypothetical protein